MGRPVAKSADVVHENARSAALVLQDEMPDGVVQVKCRSDRYRRNGDADQPIKNGSALHK